MLYFDIFLGLEHGNSFKSLDLGQHIWVMQPRSVSKLIEFCWYDFTCKIQSTDPNITMWKFCSNYSWSVWRLKLTIETVPDRDIEISVTARICHWCEKAILSFPWSKPKMIIMHYDIAMVYSWLYLLSYGTLYIQLRPEHYQAYKHMYSSLLGYYTLRVNSFYLV